MKVLIVVDMQNDFVTGPLGTPEARAIVPKVADKIRDFSGLVVYTLDTHHENYMETMEGKKLPVPHCIEHTEGWETCPEIPDADALNKWGEVFTKTTFGSVRLAEKLRSLSEKGNIEEVELVGVCTDICVISNALLLKAFLPETEISVDASCCAGVTPESHRNALEAMKMCQINIKGENA